MVRIRILNTTSDIKIGNVPQELLVYKEEILKIIYYQTGNQSSSDNTGVHWLPLSQSPNAA